MTLQNRRRIGFRRQTMQVLQPAIVAGARTVFDLRRLLIVIGLSCLVLLLPRPNDLSIEGHRALALFVFTASILTLEPVPLPIASLLVPVAQVALGLADVNTALRPFSSPVVFLILGSLFLSTALQKHGLSARIAYNGLLLARGKVTYLLAAFMGVASALAMWVNNTATTVMLLPVASMVTSRISDPLRARKILALFTMGIVAGATLGSLGTVLGDPSIALASDWLGRTTHWGFIDWMRYGLPSALVLVPITWYLLKRYMSYDVYNLDIENVKHELTNLGGLSSKEKEILLVLFASVIMWVGGSTLETALQLPRTLFSSAIVAIGAVGALSARAVIDWDDLKGVSWGVFFIIGAGLSLGDALDRSTASAWFANKLGILLQNHSYLVMLVLLVFITNFMSNFMNNATISAIIVPILVKISSDLGIPSYRLVVPATVSIVYTFILPSSSARMAIVGASGILSRRDMTRIGMILQAHLLIATVLLFYLMSLIGYI